MCNRLIVSRFEDIRLKSAFDIKDIGVILNALNYWHYPVLLNCLQSQDNRHRQAENFTLKIYNLLIKIHHLL